MDKKSAVSAFQYGERSKSELLIASQLISVLSGLKDAERTGGKKIVLQALESIRIELQFAFRASNMHEFQRSIDSLNTAISYVEGNDLDSAIIQIGSAISHATTVAQAAWEELEKYEFI